MNTLLIFLFILISILIVWINLPGTFLFALFILCIDYIHAFEMVGKKTIIIIFIICLLLEMIEFFISSLTLKKYGGNNSTIIASIIGSIIGSIFGSMIFPIIGSLLGFILGGFGGSYYFEIKRGTANDQAIKIAKSTTLSYILSKALKSIIIILYGVYLILTL